MNLSTPAIALRTQTPSRARWISSCLVLGLVLTGTALLAQSRDRMELGHLPTGATLSFIRGADGDWGLAVDGGSAPGFGQAKPARIEVYQADNDIRSLVAGYKTVERSAAGSGFEARADIAFGNQVVFRVHDRWSLDGDVATVRRTVDVSGTAPGGFESSVEFAVDPSVNGRT